MALVEANHFLLLFLSRNSFGAQTVLPRVMLFLLNFLLTSEDSPQTEFGDPAFWKNQFCRPSENLCRETTIQESPGISRERVQERCSG